jgi:hypothetical protein
MTALFDIRGIDIEATNAELAFYTDVKRLREES